nr:hypothetical protein [Tanacetum cinerariifolium]
LRAPIEGYAEAIVVLPILAEQFELKHSLINMMTSDQFFGLEKDNPHDHIRWVARRWLKKEPPYSIHTWEDLVSIFINELFPPQEQQISVMKSPIFNNDLMNQIAKLTHAVNQQTSAVTTAMTAILKQFQATPPPAFVKSVEEICVTCGGAHPYYQCLAADGNTFPELRDNIQGYVSAAAVNYNQALISNKEKLQELENTPLNENCSAVILKKLPKKLRDPRKFLIMYGFSELKCKALADLGITRDVFVPVGKLTFPANFVNVDYESNPRVHLILGRPFLQTARALIDVHGEEMILHDGDERLTLNMRHDTSSYSHQPQKESINLINVFNNLNEDFLEDLFSTNQPSDNPTFSSHPELTSPKVKNDIFDPKGGNVLPKKLLDLDSTKDLHTPLHVNPLSSSTTYYSSPNQLLKEFTDELALITFPPKYDDDLQFDIESDLKEIEYLLYHDPIKDIDSSLKDSIDQSNFVDNLVDSMPEMFTDEHALDYSSPLIFDEYDDDLFKVESDTKNVYDDPFNSKGEKIKKSKLLIDELDLPCNFLPSFEYDSFLSEDFSMVDALPSTNNEDKVFNPRILIQENPFVIITRVAKDKKLATSNASLMIEDFDPPLYELPFFNEVPRCLQPKKVEDGVNDKEPSRRANDCFRLWETSSTYIVGFSCFPDAQSNGFMECKGTTFDLPVCYTEEQNVLI